MAHIIYFLYNKVATFYRSYVLENKIEYKLLNKFISLIYSIKIIFHSLLDSAKTIETNSMLFW